VSLSSLAVALLHAPVLDRRGDTVSSAVTNLDLHDIARSAKTFGLGRFYIVTPLAEQQRLVSRLLAHWLDGHGAEYNPKRKQALELIRVCATVEEALEDWKRDQGSDPLPVLTGASRPESLSFEDLRSKIDHQPAMLLLGTGWGIAPELFDRGWPTLSSIKGASEYNHLPVRAAAAIMFDRLLQVRE
jgi:hypothetical protein